MESPVNNTTLEAVFYPTPEPQEKINIRMRLIDNSHDPAVRNYLDAEARLLLHRERVLKQIAVVDRVMNEAERDVSHLVTSKWIHKGAGGERNNDERLVSSSLYLGPALHSVTADARVQECMKMLLGGTPEFVEDVTFIAQMSAFAHSTESIDASCVALEKLITEAYGTTHELCACVNPQHAKKLSNMVENGRRVYASMAQLVFATHSSSVAVQRELADLQGKMEVLQQHHQKALRIGRDLIKENETLRRQLFRATVQTSRNIDVSDDPNAVALSERGIELQRVLSTRVVVLVQAEGCHELRFKQPSLVSHALLVLQSVTEAVSASHNGTRVNYNPLHETREHFNLASNRCFPSESYAFSFNKASDAFLFTTELNYQLAQNARWPDELLEMDKFAVVESNDGTSAYVWRGLKVRAAIHAGIPFITYPLAELEDAGREGDATSTHALTSTIAFYGGLAIEKAMLLLQKARAGETLATADAAKMFESERFLKPDLGLTLNVVERQIVGMLVGFAADEKIYGVVARALQLRLADAPPFALQDLVTSVFPSTTFWRQIDQSNEFATQDFEDDQHAMVSTALLPHQYEEKISSLQSELVKEREQRLYLSENTTRLNQENMRLADDLFVIGAKLKTSQETTETLRQKLSRIPAIFQAGERLAMEAYDLVGDRDAALREIDTRLSEAQAVADERQTVIDELRRPKICDDEATNTDEPFFPEHRKKSFLAAAGGGGVSRTASFASSGRGGLGESSSERFAGVARYVAECGSVFLKVLDMERSVAEVTEEFDRLTAKFLDPDWVPDDTVPLSVTYEKLTAGTVPEGMYGSAQERGVVEGMALVTQVVTRLALSRAVGEKMKGLSQKYGNELEYLMDTNSKLEATVEQLNAARRREEEVWRREVHDTEMRGLRELQAVVVRNDELELQVKHLELLSIEANSRAQRFFAECCELMDRLETQPASGENNADVKSTFELLKETYSPFVGKDLPHGEGIQALKTRIHTLETNLQARTTELALRERLGRNAPPHNHDTETRLEEPGAAVSGKNAVHGAAEAVLTAEEHQKMEENITALTFKLLAAERELKRRDLKAQAEHQAALRRQTEEKRREELRAAREEVEQELREAQFESRVENEVQKRLADMQRGVRSDGGAMDADDADGVVDVHEPKDLASLEPTAAVPTRLSVEEVATEARVRSALNSAVTSPQISSIDPKCDPSRLSPPTDAQRQDGASTSLVSVAAAAMGPSRPDAAADEERCSDGSERPKADRINESDARPPTPQANVFSAEFIARLPRSVLPLSSIIPDAIAQSSSALPSRQSSARTFVCTSCSQRFVFRKGHSAASLNSVAEEARGPDDQPADPGRRSAISRANGSTQQRADAVEGAQCGAATGREMVMDNTKSVAGWYDSRRTPSVLGDVQSSSSPSPLEAFPDRVLPLQQEAASDLIESKHPPSVKSQGAKTTTELLSLHAVAAGDGYVILANPMDAAEMDQITLLDQTTQVDAALLAPYASPSRPVGLSSPVESNRAGSGAPTPEDATDDETDRRHRPQSGSASSVSTYRTSNANGRQQSTLVAGPPPIGSLRDAQNPMQSVAPKGRMLASNSTTLAGDGGTSPTPEKGPSSSLEHRRVSPSEKRVVTDVDTRCHDQHDDDKDLVDAASQTSPVIVMPIAHPSFDVEDAAMAQSAVSRLVTPPETEQQLHHQKETTGMSSERSSPTDVRVAHSGAQLPLHDAVAARPLSRHAERRGVTRSGSDATAAPIDSHTAVGSDEDRGAPQGQQQRALIHSSSVATQTAWGRHDASTLTLAQQQHLPADAAHVMDIGVQWEAPNFDGGDAECSDREAPKASNKPSREQLRQKQRFLIHGPQATSAELYGGGSRAGVASRGSAGLLEGNTRAPSPHALSTAADAQRVGRLQPLRHAPIPTVAAAAVRPLTTADAKGAQSWKMDSYDRIPSPYVDDGSGRLFGKHPHAALERRSRAVVSSLSSEAVPGSGLSGSLISQLMVGAERDIREVTHVQQREQTATPPADAPLPRHAGGNEKGAVHGQDYDYMEHPFGPWDARRPFSGDNVRGSSPRRTDGGEDIADGVLTRFGHLLGSRDEISIRSAHIKTPPVTAKYDVIRKALPRPTFVIGRLPKQGPAEQ